MQLTQSCNKGRFETVERIMRISGKLLSRKKRFQTLLSGSAFCGLIVSRANKAYLLQKTMMH